MQVFTNIIVLTAIYALICCGYVLVYRVSRVLNLAHGELMLLGAYLLLATASLFGGHPVLALGAALVLSLCMGIAVYLLLMRRMTGEMVVAAVLVAAVDRRPVAVLPISAASTTVKPSQMSTGDRARSSSPGRRTGPRSHLQTAKALGPKGLPNDARRTMFLTLLKWGSS